MRDPRSEARRWLDAAREDLAYVLDPVPAAFAALLDAARELDLLYVPTRYPNGLDAGTPARAFSQVHSGRASELAERFVAAAAAALA